MKESIIIRRVDDLGRFVLPKDVRKKLNIRTGDYLELSIENDTIQMKKYSCIQNLEYVAKLIIESIYEFYKIDAVLFEDNKVIAKREEIQIKRIIEEIEKNQYTNMSIMFEGKEVGKLIVLSKKEEIRNVLEFISLFLSKYLEQ